MKVPSKRKIIEGLVLTGGIYVGYRVISNMIKNHRAKSTADLADQSSEVRQAMGLRAAMNPSGVSWLMWSDGTNEEAIEQIASQIVNLNAVSAAYRRLFDSELTVDLRKELSTEGFNDFLARISNNRINQSTNKGSNQNGAYTSPMMLIVAKKDVFVRTSPDASYHGAWYEGLENKNIYKTSKAGEFIGYATGKQHYDSKNKVRFIEVAYKVGPKAPDWLKPHIGKTKILWVSASSSYTDQVSSVQVMESKYPKTKGVTKYRLPINGLGWLSQPGSRVVSIKNGELFNKQFQPKGVFKSNTILGYPVMQLHGDSSEYTMVRTLAGQDLWVKSNQTTLQ